MTKVIDKEKIRYEFYYNEYVDIEDFIDYGEIGFLYISKNGVERLRFKVMKEIHHTANYLGWIDAPDSDYKLV